MLVTLFLIMAITHFPLKIKIMISVRTGKERYTVRADFTGPGGTAPLVTNPT